ncbi:phage virion morphogenesis protein [Avibacterium paragallinarum]|uniref:phage virion morphogenesis protein n=1 Tax=Avibacterium paragallinarum TaxID=728 RepID=UPI0039884BF6
MHVTGGFTKETLKQFKSLANYFRLSPKIKQQTMQRVLWRLKRKTEQNVTRQQTPEGKPWKPRKKPRKGLKNKMLRRRGQYLNSKLEFNGNQGRLTYTNKRSAQVAAIHQYGLEVTNIQNKQDKIHLERLLKQNNQKATPKQAKRLKELGYTVSTGKKLKNGKTKRKNASMKDITSRLSRGQAGLIIRMIEEKQGIKIRRGLRSYKMTKREFLDENEQRNAEVITEELFKAFERSGIHLTL